MSFFLLDDEEEKNSLLRDSFLDEEFRQVESLEAALCLEIY